MEQHFPIKSGQPIEMALVILNFVTEFPNKGKEPVCEKWNYEFRSEYSDRNMWTPSRVGLSRLCSATFEQLFAVLATSSKFCLSEQFLSKYWFRAHIKHEKVNDFLENLNSCEFLEGCCFTGRAQKLSLRQRRCHNI